MLRKHIASVLAEGANDHETDGWILPDGQFVPLDAEWRNHGWTANEIIVNHPEWQQHDEEEYGDEEAAADDLVVAGCLPVAQWPDGTYVVTVGELNASSIKHLKKWLSVANQSAKLNLTIAPDETFCMAVGDFMIARNQREIRQLDDPNMRGSNA